VILFRDYVVAHYTLQKQYSLSTLTCLLAFFCSLRDSNIKIIMKFSAIAVTVVALSAQLTLTAASNDLTSCNSDVADCLEFVISDTDQCSGNTVTYCLKPKAGADSTGSTCKSLTSTDTYSHINVYVDGLDVNLLRTDGLFPSATCPNGESAKTCEYKVASNQRDSCNVLDNYNLFDQTGFTQNVGLKCEETNTGPCVTVPLVVSQDGKSASHAEIVFSVKDRSGCEENGGGWMCTVGEGTNGKDSCSCSGGISSCTFEGIVSCEPPSLPPGGGGGQGDPHFKTWRGQHFDFHGECDLILLQSSTFESGLGMDVHIRTQIRNGMSFISSAALRIGTDVLEVASQGVYYLNGVAGADLPAEFSGLAFSHTEPTNKQHVFDVHIGGREHIKIKTYKDFVSVLVEMGHKKHFGDSVGLMGDFEMGQMIARDGNTVLNDWNAFGQEWQVLETEPKLFQTVRFPQHPHVCTMPAPKLVSQLRRRLSESTVEELAAEKACAQWGEGKDDCVFDVLATGDLDMATAGSY
jgi:hypothetical protein